MVFFYNMLFSPVVVTDGSIFLDWVEIGKVVPRGSVGDNFTFVYNQQENAETVWQGTFLVVVVVVAECCWYLVWQGRLCYYKVHIFSLFLHLISDIQ